MTALDARTLLTHCGRLTVPTYDRAGLSPAVVHFGVGSFHRSHQAVYFDDLAERGISSDWGIVGVGLHRRDMVDVLTAQDGLYVLVTRGAEADQARVIGAIRRYLYAPLDPPSVATTLADPRTRLVTLTITGNGYHVHPEDDRASPSAIGFIVEGLARRRAAGVPPFTVLSCDNIPDNGALCREAVVRSAAAADPRLAEWIATRVAFPGSLVDRITPRTTIADRERVEQLFGVRDRWPVVTEPYSRWVIEDRFSHGRPPLDRVGVSFVGDVRPYALIKTRLLNATHCALGHLAPLAGHRTVSETMADPLFDAYVAQMTAAEISPLLPTIPGFDLPAYRRTVRERLANPKISDQLVRLARNASGKFPVHVLPTIADARRAGTPHPLLTLAVAGWYHALYDTGEDAADVESDDPRGGRLRRLARAGRGDPQLLLSDRSVFGALGDDRWFVTELREAIEDIADRGVRAAIGVRLGGERLVA